MERAHSSPRYLSVRKRAGTLAAMAELARGKLRKKILELKQTLQGHVMEHPVDGWQSTSLEKFRG